MSQTETSNSYPTSARNQVKRRHDRGFYDHDTVHRILDSSMLCHVSYAIDGQPYMLTISPEGLKLVPKGKRKGLELAWKALVSGEAALATALNASLAR